MTLQCRIINILDFNLRKMEDSFAKIFADVNRVLIVMAHPDDA